MLTTGDLLLILVLYCSLCTIFIALDLGAKGLLLFTNKTSYLEQISTLESDLKITKRIVADRDQKICLLKLDLESAKKKYGKKK